MIRLICKEMSSKEIAASLFLSELTITTHRRNIFRKLDVKNVAGLMNFAKEDVIWVQPAFTNSFDLYFFPPVINLL